MHFRDAKARFEISVIISIDGILQIWLMTGLHLDGCFGGVDALGK